MRIDITRIIAVLSLAASIDPSGCTSSSFPVGQRHHSRRPTKVGDHNKYIARSGGSESDIEGESRLWPTHRDYLMLLNQEGGMEGHAVECCPSRLEMIEPEGGKNQDDIYVELYRDGEIRQRFYEVSCKEEVHEKPCRFLDRKLYNQSKCVQKYSYTYALVRDTESQREPRQRPGFPSDEWKMDYIRVRSGCSCEVTPKFKKKRNPKTKKSKSSRRRLFDYDETES